MTRPRRTLTLTSHPHPNPNHNPNPNQAVQNGGQLFRHEGFMRRRQPWCGSRVVVLLLQQPTPAWCIDSRPAFKVWKPNLGRSGETWGTYEVLHRPPECAYAAVTPEEVRQPRDQ